jgi:hypothetical protein
VPRYSFKELGAVITAPRKQKPKKQSIPIEHTGVPEDFLEALKSLNKDNQNKAMIDKVLAGESFAEPGERDEAMQRVCSTMAWMPEARELAAETIAEVMRPSLSVWANEEDNPKLKSLEEEMEKALEKISRAQVDQQDHRQRQFEDLAGLRAALRSKPIDEMDNEFILRHAIIQFRSSYYVYNFDQQCYIGPKTKEELLTYAHQAWKNAPDGLDLSYVSKGVDKQKSIPRILHEYAMCADKVIGQFCLDESYYDFVRNRFFEAIAPIRSDLSPLFNKRIAHWLSLLAGKHLDKLLDWLAALPQLQFQCCALYLDGSPGSGKGMLANGASQIFRVGGPVPLEDVLGDFNADIFECPLLFLDEGVSWYRGNISTQLRGLIGASSHNYKQKNLANRPVIGSIRLLIAANNDNVLAFGDDHMSANDLQAYVQRFLHIPVSDAASKWLQENDTTGWVDDGLIAQHILWLKENREIVHGKRFIVEGVSMDAMHRKLVTQGDLVGPMYEWIARFASNPKELYKHAITKSEEPKAFIGEGKLLVNAQGMLDGWGVYMGKHSQPPKTTHLGRALSKMSEGSAKLGSRDNRVRYHQIRFDLVVGWAIDNQIGDDFAMRQNYEATEHIS